MADPKPNLPTDDAPHRDAMDDIFRKLDDAGIDLPKDTGGRLVDQITMAASVTVTREDFQNGGPDFLITKVRTAAMALRDDLGAEVRKRKWKFDF